MNKLFVFIALVAIVTACAHNVTPLSRNEIVKRDSQEILKKTLNDPASYQFADFNLLDSMTYRQSLDFRRKSFSDFLDQSKSLAIYSSDKYTKKNIEMNAEILQGLDSLAEVDEACLDSICAYKYELSYRAKNDFGAIVFGSVLLWSDYDGKVIDMAESEDKISLVPKDIPGYYDYISKEYNKFEKKYGL